MDEFQFGQLQHGRSERVDDARPRNLQAICRGMPPSGEHHAGGARGTLLEIAEAWSKLAEEAERRNPDQEER
jgi:hypothetical protein